MIGLQFHNVIPTKAALNGPFLRFTGAGTTQPFSTSFCSGSTATFIGVATAFFPTQDPPLPDVTNLGNLSYRWYEVGVGALSDGTNITGSATTSLTLSNLTSPTSNQRKFYLTADYIPSAYQSSTPVTAGTARSTGNAVNEPISSGVGTLTVYPLLEIIGQPSNRNVLINNNTTFTVDAGLTDSSFNNSLTTYQWYVNGNAVNDGDIDTTSSTSTTTTTSFDDTYTNDTTLSLPSTTTRAWFSILNLLTMLGAA